MQSSDCVVSTYENCTYRGTESSMQSSDWNAAGLQEVRGPVTGGHSVAEHHEHIMRVAAEDSQQLVCVGESQQRGV